MLIAFWCGGFLITSPTLEPQNIKHVLPFFINKNELVVSPPLWKTSSSKYVKIWIHFPQKNARWTFLQKFSTLKPPGPSDAKKLSPTWINLHLGTPRKVPLQSFATGSLGFRGFQLMEINSASAVFQVVKYFGNSVCFVHLDIKRSPKPNETKKTQLRRPHLEIAEFHLAIGSKCRRNKTHTHIDPWDDGLFTYMKGCDFYGKNAVKYIP